MSRRIFYNCYIRTKWPNSIVSFQNLIKCEDLTKFKYMSKFDSGYNLFHMILFKKYINKYNFNSKSLSKTIIMKKEKIHNISKSCRNSINFISRYE